MVRSAIPARLGRRLGCPFLLACLLGLALLLGHQLVMATPRHSMAMAAWSALAAPVDASEQEHREPLTGWEECLTQLGALPLMLLLLALVGLRGRPGHVLPSVDASHPWSRLARCFHPPPLEPSRRRALLQVFLI